MSFLKHVAHPGYVAAAMVLCALGVAGGARADQPIQVAVDWSKTTAPLKSVPTLQVVVNPMLRPGSAIHDAAFSALQDLGADYVRFVPWEPYPKLAVAELDPPHEGGTSWDFSLIDPPMLDFFKATAGHPTVVNFSTAPAWMFRTPKPVTYPADPNEVNWDYSQGTELVDPTGRQLGEYYARLVSWYTRGGFTDEAGRFRRSDHHFEIAYWEVFNEMEHGETPQQYTRRYDAVVGAIHKVSPGTKFVGLALDPLDPGMIEYFLNPRNHVRGTPLDMISYHFYATPGPTESLEQWQYSFFSQADDFIIEVQFIERVRMRLSPATRTTIDEVGSILPNDAWSQTPAPIPAAYWNLSGATYAYLYAQLSPLGIDVLGESQLVGYPTQYPDVTMIDWTSGRPNARYWVLRLLKESFTPGDVLVATTCTDPAPHTITSSGNPDVAAQAYRSASGHRKLLLVNKRNRSIQVALPEDAAGAALQVVDEATGQNPARTSSVMAQTLELAPFAVAVVRLH
jgi:hypothetical protein